MAAFYINSLAGFLKDSSEIIIGHLTNSSKSFYQLLGSAIHSWGEEIEIFKKAFDRLIANFPYTSEWGFLLEYPIARREKRIDAVLLCGDIVIVLEFKLGQEGYILSSEEQLIDYCLDLRDFHFESRNKIIIPVLVATDANAKNNVVTKNIEWVQNVCYANKSNLYEVFKVIIESYSLNSNKISLEQWNLSKYSPTPTIIEAAQTLYAGKSVEEISRSHAGTTNLTKTTQVVIEAIKEAKLNNRKVICFITGVPGAGKTLAGLNIAHHEEFQKRDESLATFLSGNGPLIKVLREALSRDAFKRISSKEKNLRRYEIDRKINSFIENVHRFIDSCYEDSKGNFDFSLGKKPNNNIIIFDEAQRAWNAEHSQRKFGRPYSEAELLLNLMNKHSWAVVVALVGGGQEINTGEAGLREWGNILEKKFSSWKIFISPELKTGNHSTGNLTLFEKIPQNMDVIENKHLHLDVSIRSYKAEQLSSWVGLILSGQNDQAKKLLQEELKNYEIVITRDLQKAKAWLREKCKGTRRMGLVASSGGRRLRAYGLDVKLELEEADWFLNPRNDVRSSYYLEVPATEFGIQGLELDWAGVCWDADLRRNDVEWDFKAFKGSSWRNIINPATRQFLINKYRVLLTRAREGMVIWIPDGDKKDETRRPEFYDPIFEYLISCGLKSI